LNGFNDELMARDSEISNAREPAGQQRAEGSHGFRLVWLLLLAGLGWAGYYFLIDRVDHRLTSEITRQLRRQFPHHLISVDRARLVPGKSITIDGVRVSKATDRGLRDVLRVGRVVCEGPLDVVGLVQGQLPVQKVIVDGLEVCIWPLSSGLWSVQELSNDKPLPAQFPSVEVRSGLLRVGQETVGREREIICHDLRATIGLDNANSAVATHRDTNVPDLLLHASVASSYFTNAALDARMSHDKSLWGVRGSIQGMDYSNRLVDQLPSSIRSSLQIANGFSAEADLAFAASNHGGAISVDAKANIQNGRLLHPMVPYPLEQIAAELSIQNQQIHIRKCSAKSGKAEIQIECDIQGFTTQSPVLASVAIRNLALDEQLYRALPAVIQDHWNRLGISGVVDASASIRFDGTTWQPKVLVRAKDGGIHADFFPYPVRNLRGDFVYENGCIYAPNLTGIAGGKAINGSLTLQQAQPKWLMDLVLASDAPIPINEDLLRALTPRDAPASGFHRFVQSLHPTGTVLLRRGRFIRTAERPEVISRSLELTFSECTVKYDGFRYPITDVHGQATLDNDRLVLREFVGRNDSARIKGEGVGTCRDANLETLDLVFNAFDVPLDDELQQALPASARNLWDQLQPNGTMDRIAVQIRRQHAREPMDLRVEMVEEHSSTGPGRSISFRPKSFPYSIHDVSCSIDYRPGRIDIRSLSGAHDSSRIQTEGQIQLLSNGEWKGLISCLPPSRLLVDQNLMSCLPPTLRDAMTRLNFRGPVGVTGTTQLESQSANGSSLLRAWNLNLELEDARLGQDLASGIRGSLYVSGENSESGTIAYGTMAIDAMSIKNVAVTGLEGPFVFERNQLLLGRDAAAWQSLNYAKTRNSVAGLTMVDPNVVPASTTGRLVGNSHLQNGLPEQSGGPPRWLSQPIRPLEDVPVLDVREGEDLRARTLSGTIFLSGVEPLNGERARYRLRLVDADFHGLLVDLGETHTQATGKLSVQIDLQGSANNWSSMEGNGKAWLRGSKLYELPFMIKLFGSLSVRPDDSAFNSADISFSIDGDRIPVNDLQLDGNLLSMRGSGWVNMRRELSLDLYANVGRHSLIGSVVRPFTQHRAANLMRVQVSGTTNNPQMIKSVPLMDSLEHVFPESP
jgi:hypothetical protein